MIWVSAGIKCLRYIFKYYSVDLHTTDITFSMYLYLELFWACVLLRLRSNNFFFPVGSVLCIFICAPEFFGQFSKKCKSALFLKNHCTVQLIISKLMTSLQFSSTLKNKKEIKTDVYFERLNRKLKYSRCRPKHSISLLVVIVFNV